MKTSCTLLVVPFLCVACGVDSTASSGSGGSGSSSGGYVGADASVNDSSSPTADGGSDGTSGDGGGDAADGSIEAAIDGGPEGGADSGADALAEVGADAAGDATEGDAPADSTSGHDAEGDVQLADVAPDVGAEDTGSDVHLPGLDAGGDSGFGWDLTTAPSYLVNPAHTGAVVDNVLRPPLKRLFSVPPASAAHLIAVSYPLIVQGRIYLLVQTEPDGGVGAATTGLWAFDAHTGATLWGPVETKAGFAHAYDSGRLFVVNTAGLVQSFDAASGTPGWTYTVPNPGYPPLSSAPTAYKGILYVASESDTLFALDEATGKVLWNKTIYGGDDSAPTVADEGVYVSYACVQAYGFDRLTGTPLWHYAGPCGGGGGLTTVLFDGILYARDTATANLKLNAATGTALGSFNARFAPAFDGHAGFFVGSGGLSAVDLATNSVSWTFVGDSYALTTSPVVANGEVYVGSQGGVIYGLDEATGNVDWSEVTGAQLGDSEVYFLVAMAAAEGILAVPEGPSLVVYGP